MVYEWYTGSDSSKQIAKRFEKLYYRSRGKLPVDVIIREIEELAQGEQDPNMRAKFLTAAARLRLQNPGKAPQGLSMGDVVKLYDPLAANFPWVITDYLEACLWCAIQVGEREGEEAWRCVGPYALALALWHQGRLDQTTACWAVAVLAESLLELGKELQSRVLLEMAAAAAIRAHHWDSEDPRVLEVLAEAHKLLGDVSVEARVQRELGELGLKKKINAVDGIKDSFKLFLRLFGLIKK